jgi:hypothetical protein
MSSVTSGLGRLLEGRRIACFALCSRVPPVPSEVTGVTYPLTAMPNEPRLTLRVVLFCIAALLCGCKATPPGKVETFTMTRVKRWLLLPNSHKANPVVATPENISFGKESFSRYAFHGLTVRTTE